MKKMIFSTLLIFLLFNSVFLYGQGKAALGIENVDVECYLNGVQFDLDKVYLNLMNIESVEVVKTLG